VVILALIPAAFAAEVALQIDTRELVVGQAVPVKLQVINGSVSGMPELPVGAGLLAQYQGSSQQHVMVNFKSTRITEYTYQVAATQKGVWRVGPVNLVVSGERMRAEAIEVAVGDPPVDQGGDPVVATISDDRPFVGQVVVYRFQFKYDRPLVNARWTRPEFLGFVEEVNTEANQREFQMTDGGRPYTVQTIEVPLVAAGTGMQTISPATLTAQFKAERRKKRSRRSIDDVFGNSPFGLRGSTETLALVTKVVPVDIQPLPMDEQPADFSGLVGQFKATMKTGQTEVKMGESVTLEYTLTGDGTLAGFGLPKAKEGAGFRIYDDEPEVATKLADGRFRSRLTLRRAVVPEVVGPLTIPSIDVITFSPKKQTYVTVSTRPFQLQVAPGEEGGGVVTSYVDQDIDKRTAVESTGEDILPVSRAGGVGNRTVAAAFPYMAGGALFPGIVWILLGFVGLVSGRKVDPKTALKARLKALPVDPAPRLAALESLFRDAAALRLGVPAPSLSLQQVEGLGEDAVALYGDLERVRYGGGDAESLEARVRRFVGAS
jgi:hypothetical protein